MWMSVYVVNTFFSAVLLHSVFNSDVFIQQLEWVWVWKCERFVPATEGALGSQWLICPGVTTGKIWIQGKPKDRLSAWAQLQEGSTLCMCRYMQVCMNLPHCQTFLIIRHWVEWDEAIGAIWVGVSAECTWDTYIYVCDLCVQMCIYVGMWYMLVFE